MRWTQRAAQKYNNAEVLNITNDEVLQACVQFLEGSSNGLHYLTFVQSEFLSQFNYYFLCILCETTGVKPHKANQHIFSLAK